MCKPRAKISLGFADQEFEEGVHVCQIFNDNNERHEALINFILSGLDAGDRISCFTENETSTSLDCELNRHNYSFKPLFMEGKLSLSGTNKVYFEENRFEPERMLALLETFYNESVSNNFPGARVIGEMTSKIEEVKGGSRLLEYESRVSMLLKSSPVTAVCQYDANNFSGATIMDILKVHPYMIIKGKVVKNPFYITPEVFLGLA